MERIFFGLLVLHSLGILFSLLLSEPRYYGSNPPTSSASPLVYCCSSVTALPPSLYALPTEPRDTAAAEAKVVWLLTTVAHSLLHQHPTTGIFVYTNLPWNNHSHKPLTLLNHLKYSEEIITSQLTDWRGNAIVVWIYLFDIGTRITRHTLNTSSIQL